MIYRKPTQICRPVSQASSSTAPRLPPVPSDRLKDLQERTRYSPAEVERRIFARWEEAGIFHPEPGGDAAENFSIAVPAAQRDRGAAHGPRAQRLDPGPADPGRPDERPAGQVDLRHRPRGHRHPGQGRAGARGGGHDQGGPRDARRSSSASGSGGASTARPSSSSSSAIGASLDYERRALHDGRGLREGRAPRVHEAVREGPRLPRQLHGQLGPGHTLGDLRARGRAAPGGGHALLGRLPAGLRVGIDHHRHGAPRDDAGRHRHRREPVRRALHAPDRGGGAAAAGGPAAADHRRRVREDRLRHRRAQDHARATIPTTSTSGAGTASRRSR